MKAKVGVNLSGKIKLTLTDIRDGSKQVIEKNNMLLNQFFNSWFTSSVEFSPASVMHTCFLGTGDTPPQPTDTGLSGTILASNSSPTSAVAVGVPTEPSAEPVALLNSPNPDVTSPLYVDGNSAYNGFFTIKGNYMVFPHNQTSTLYLCKQTPSLDFEVVDTFPTGVGNIREIIISEDLTRVLICGTSSPYIELYEIMPDDTLSKITTPTVPEKPWGGAFSLNSNLIYLGLQSNSELVTLDVEDGEYVIKYIEIEDVSSSISGIALSLDGKFLAIAANLNIYVYRVEDHSLTLHGVESVGYNPLTLIYSTLPYSFYFGADNILHWVYGGQNGYSKVYNSWGRLRVNDEGISSLSAQRNHFHYLKINVKNYTFMPRDTYSSIELPPFITRLGRDIDFAMPRVYHDVSGYNHNLAVIQEDGNNNLYAWVENSFKRYTPQGFDVIPTIGLRGTWTFPAGVGTGSVRELGLRGSTTSRWVARQVLDHPIEKTEFQQLDVEWEISATNLNEILGSGVISSGQINGQDDIYYKCTVSPRNLYELLFGSGKNTLFGLLGSPTFIVNESNEGFSEVSGYKHINSLLAELNSGDISSESITRNVNPYVADSFTRSVRLFIDTDKFNQNIGTLSMTSGLNLTFDPPLQKVNTHRLYIDIEFGLNLNQGGE